MAVHALPHRQQGKLLRDVFWSAGQAFQMEAEEGKADVLTCLIGDMGSCRGL